MILPKISRKNTEVKTVSAAPLAEALELSGVYAKIKPCLKN